MTTKLSCAAQRNARPTMTKRSSPRIEIRPRRNSGEGAIGYLMRMARAHGIPKLPEMLLQLGIPWFKLAQGKQVDVVANAAAADLAALSYDTGIVADGKVLLRGERLYRGQWSVYAGRRACPGCLADDPIDPRLPRRWHRAWWDVQPLTVCPIHGARLLGSCARCGEHLDFRSTAIDRCSNGHALIEAGTSRAPIAACAGDEYLLSRLGAVPRIACRVLDSGTLGDAIQALDLVGAASLKGHALREARGIDRHVLLDAGYRVFAAWPAAFDAILDALLAASGIGPGRWGAAAAYGQFHSGLHELGNGLIATALKERTRRHAVANGVAISRMVFGVVEPAKDLCSIKEAAGRLGLGFERARRELAGRGLVPQHTRRGTPVAIPRVAVENLLSERRATLGLRMVAKELRIGRMQARRLASAGVFGAAGTILRGNLDQFIEKLSAIAPLVPQKDGTPLPKGCRTARCGIDLAVDAILKGRIHVAGFCPGRGLDGVLVRITDLRQLGKDERDRMTIDDAADLLELKWETVRGLIRLRLLRSGKDGIARAAIEAFRRDFVLGVRLAQAASLCSRTLMKVMFEAGISPAAAPPRCRQVFYRRLDIVSSRRIASTYPALRAVASTNEAA
ncbi:TniQ family protein [Bradyrhizobium sp. CB1650]|uniref:TniQ family protein n=1 Tax=Bradyrhizobium sp. CB1650 TaxID=3039153 RepID=UPI0024357432|nr:TniQ family protein [Bradyrhizobium sp. CB1650]WGD52444.1 TniQ family protein [Bradyrhizobium sp. CB1650]